MDPGRNADYAAGMLSGLLDQYGGDVHKALSAYNSGSPTATGTTTRWSDGETLGYADSVMRHYQRLTGAAHSEAIAEAPSTVASVGTLRSAAAQFPLPAPSLSSAAHAHTIPPRNDRLSHAGRRRFRRHRFLFFIRRQS